MPTRVRVLYHDHCFDGAASAAFFSRFYRGAINSDVDFFYTGMAHRASQIFDDSLFDGDENAIVDFKYSNNPRLTWWFDHHQSAFLTPEDQKHYEATKTPQKMYDTSYKSCTSYIRDVARDRWGFTAPDLENLVHWATIIDGAKYADAKSAVELGEPGDETDTRHRRLQGLRYGTANHSADADEVAGRYHQSSPKIQQVYQPLYKRHLDSIEIIREKSSGKKRRDHFRSHRLRS